MTISVGSASGSTGLAGRLRTAIDTIFSAFTRDFSVNSVGDKGLNAQAQGIVDAFNNDKVDTVTQMSGTVVANYNLTSTMTLSDNSNTIVNFNSSELDTDSAVTTGTSWKFTVPTGKGGKYHIDAIVSCLSIPVAGQYYAMIYVNGSERRRGALMSPSGAGVSISGLITVSAADTVDIRVFQNSGGPETASIGYVNIFRLPGA